MQITVQMQITFIPESSTKYTPTLEDINELGAVCRGRTHSKPARRKLGTFNQVSSA